jgi:AcrR family transcriptional regulator
VNREPLSKQRIVDTAIRLVDHHGLEALTMRRLAEELGVEGASLYKHIANKAELVVGMLQTIAAEATPVYPDFPTWRDRLRIGMSDFREEGLRHPRVFALAQRPWRGVNSERREEDMRVMLAAGFTPEQAAYAFRVLITYVIGFVARETAALTWDPEELRQAQDLSMQIESAHPLSAAASRLLAGGRQDSAFEFGLTAMLDGIEQQVRRGAGAPD